jgi:hypothetical protein
MPAKARKNKFAIQTKNEFLAAIVAFVKKEKRPPTIRDMSQLGIPYQTMYVKFGPLGPLVEEACALKPGAFAGAVGKGEASKAKVIATYAKYVVREQRLPSHSDLRRFGVNASTVQHYFENTKGLQDAARKAHPEAFADLVGNVLFSTDRIQKLHGDVARFKRFVITTAVSGCRTHEGFCESIQRYCDVNDALLLVMMSTDPASHSEDDCLLDRHLADAHIVAEDVTINENLFLSSIKLSAKHIDPMTGLKRIGQRAGSFVYASPKQRLQMVATSSHGLPHAMMTTGAITVPDYDSRDSSNEEESNGIKYMSKRTAYIANNDHVMGAIIVEVQDDKVFHFRQVQAEESGAFVDLGKRYGPDGISSMSTEALILGDWHSGETDPEAAEAFVFGKDSVRALLKPARLILHDGFNGLSISHHDQDNAVILAQRAAVGRLSLSKEIYGYAEDLERLSNLTDEVVIVQSNHDEFLHRYLKEGRFVEDPQNTQLGCLLLHDMVDGADPLRNAIERTKVIKAPERIRWLSRDEDFKIVGIECGAHGDKGSNGSKGSMRSVEDAYGSCVVGHAHSPEILRNAWRVGTSSLLKLSYNVGPSSWLHTSCLIYANGSRQLINVIGGRWRAITQKRAIKRKAA